MASYSSVSSEVRTLPQPELLGLRNSLWKYQENEWPPDPELISIDNPVVKPVYDKRGLKGHFKQYFCIASLQTVLRLHKSCSSGF